MSQQRNFQVMRTKAFTPVLLLVLAGCGPGDSELALSSARQACETISADPVLQPTSTIPDDSELERWEEDSAKAADLSAAAAVRDPQWEGLADAYSAFADANANAVSLWRRIDAVSVTQWIPDDKERLDYRMYRAGITPAESSTVADRLDTSGAAVRNACRRVAAQVRK